MQCRSWGQSLQPFNLKIVTPWTATWTTTNHNKYKSYNFKRAPQKVEAVYHQDWYFTSPLSINFIKKFSGFFLRVFKGILIHWFIAVLGDVKWIHLVFFLILAVSKIHIHLHTYTYIYIYITNPKILNFSIGVFH